ncbi:hypothetical protein [Ekhidna sp. To15]|uniref:hypothetical protein n=1 Tax=Ekhidna sp. To15 TaxID=3395267 RepID=UPI003F52578E
MGENRLSALFDRVIIGENKKNDLRCITTDTIIRALKRSNFLGDVTKNKIEKLGSFYRGDLDLAFERLSDYLIKATTYYTEFIIDEWNKGENGIAAINKGIYGQIMLLSDLMDHLIDNRAIGINSTINDIILEVKPYLDPIIHFYNDITEEQSDDLKSRHGSGGDTKYWRTLQMVVRENYPDFNPEGLDEYNRKEAKEFNEKSFAIIRDLEQFFKVDAKNRLLNRFEEKTWWKKGVPKEVYDKAGGLALAKNREIENEEDEVEPWDCLNLIDYRKIALKNWQDIFDHAYTQPGVKKGNKEDKTKWMVQLERIRNQNFHSYSVSQVEYEFLVSLKDWLIPQES